MKQEKLKVAPNVKLEPYYAIVDTHYNIIDTYYRKQVAINVLSKLRKKYFSPNLEIVKIKNIPKLKESRNNGKRNN